jgi:hypothetical protein
MSENNHFNLLNRNYHASFTACGASDNLNS